jgi:hypothetical protein
MRVTVVGNSNNVIIMFIRTVNLVCGCAIDLLMTVSPFGHISNMCDTLFILEFTTARSLEALHVTGI